MWRKTFGDALVGFATAAFADECDAKKVLAPSGLLRAENYAVPRFVEMVQSLPRTENGKVQKFKLRERGLGALTWDREKAGVKLKR